MIHPGSDSQFPVRKPEGSSLSSSNPLDLTGCFVKSQPMFKRPAIMLLAVAREVGKWQGRHLLEGFNPVSHSNQ